MSTASVINICSLIFFFTFILFSILSNVRLSIFFISICQLPVYISLFHNNQKKREMKMKKKVWKKNSAKFASQSTNWCMCVFVNRVEKAKRKWDIYKIFYLFFFILFKVCEIWKKEKKTFSMSRVVIRLFKCFSAMTKPTERYI